MRNRKKMVLTCLLCIVLIASMIVPAMASGDMQAVASEDAPAIALDENRAEEQADVAQDEIQEPEPEEAEEPVPEEAEEDAAYEEEDSEEDAAYEGEDSEEDAAYEEEDSEEAAEYGEDSEEAASVPVVLSVSTVEGVAVSPEEITLTAEGQTAQLSVVTIPAGGEITSVQWVSSQPAIAKVDATTGVVTAGSNSGTTIVTAIAVCDDKTYNAKCTVTVSLKNGLYKDPSDGEWYYYRNGEVDWSYTGFAQNSNGWWYVENGTVSFVKNSVIKDSAGAIGAQGDWWYVVGSQVQTGFTGLAHYKNANGWWYIKDGKVDFTASGVYANQNGWWYVSGGKVNMSYNGFGSNSNGKWYCKNGKVGFDINSVLKDSTGAIGTAGTWYYVVGSQVQTGYTGVANYSNANGWWYIKNGAVDFSAYTVAKNNKGWWYVNGGKVNFGFTGLSNYKNDYGWWYINGGKVDFSAQGVYKNKNGWWYVTGGKVDFTFNGLASNSNGTWVIENGAVNFNYNGTYTYSGVTYSVSGGRATVSSSNSVGVDSTMYDTAQSRSSSTEWLVVVDISNCKVGIFNGSKGSWTAKKYWDCTTGASSTPTITGTYTIYDKGKSFGDGTYTCWYYNRFYNGYMLHSVPYYPDSMTEIKDGRLGEHLSHGCVRLALENAEWIYNNVPYNTTVYLY